jgi:hypothetical protein
VLAQMAGRLGGLVDRAQTREADALGRLEALMADLYVGLTERAEDSRLLMRELLDNEHRAEKAHAWHMQGFLDALTALGRRANPALSQVEALRRIYLVLGAMNYIAISGPTLRHMYGEAAFADVQGGLPEDIGRLVRGMFG